MFDVCHVYASTVGCGVSSWLGVPGVPCEPFIDKPFSSMSAKPCEHDWQVMMGSDGGGVLGQSICGLIARDICMAMDSVDGDGCAELLEVIGGIMDEVGKVLTWPLAKLRGMHDGCLVVSEDIDLPAFAGVPPGVLEVG